jgi:tetrahydromethanopterin S-methyltransferase subunit H
MTLHVHIERVVLEGLPLGSSDRPALGAAIESELTMLLGRGAHGWPVNGMAVRRVSGSPIGSPPHQTASAWGAAIARSIGDGIGRAVGR